MVYTVIYEGYDVVSIETVYSKAFNEDIANLEVQTCRFYPSGLVHRRERLNWMKAVFESYSPLLF